MYSLLNLNQLNNPSTNRCNQKHRLISKISGISSLFLGICLLLMVLLDKPISPENTDISKVVIASRDCLGYIGLAIVMFYGTNWPFLDSANGLTTNLSYPDHNPTFNSYVKFHRRVKKLILVVTSIYYYLVYDLGFIALDRIYFIEESYLSRYVIQYLFNSMLTLLAILAHSGAIYLLNIIYDGIIILNGSFKCFNQQLIELHSKKPSLDQLEQLRRYYSYLIQSTLQFDQFARYEICRLYIFTIIAYLFGLFGLFIHKDEKVKIISIILIFLFDSLIVTVLTLNSIMLNKNCHQEVETLYELSLPMRSAIYRSEYTADIPYEIYPDPGFLNQYPPFQGKIDDLNPSDVYEQILAAKIADLLEKDQSQHGQALLQYIPSSDRKKRVLVKRNNRSGLSRSHKKSNRVPTSQSTKPRVKTETQSKLVPETGHHSATMREHKLTKLPPKKLVESKQEKLNRKELKTISRDPLHRQAVKGDSDRSNHTLTKINHSKVISKSESNINNGKHSFTKNLRKTEMIHNPSVNYNRKEQSKVGINKPQSSMKEYFNDVDLPGGPKNIVKRSIVLPSDDDIVDGNNVFANDDDMDTGADSGESDKEEDFEGEINDEYRPIGQASASSMVVQSNPWLADEATRTLMRSLTVKRRKRGFTTDQMALFGLDDSELSNNNDDNDNNNNNNSDSNRKYIKTHNEANINERLSEADEILKTDIQDSDETPTRIVKKDGVTLEPYSIIGDIKEIKNIDNKGNDKKRSGYGEINNNSNKGLSKGQQKSINGLDDGESDDAGTNDTFFEEEFAEGLISIGDLGDLNPLNDTASTNPPDNMKKRDETSENGNQNPLSTSSTSPPFQLANADEERLDSKLDELIVNGSSDHDGELSETTIDESKRIYVNKKKRSVTPYFGRVDESLITQEEAKFTDVDDKLEKIEEALIWEALDLIKSNLDSESGDIGGKNVKNRIESRLNAAYDLEDMRIALTDLHKTMQKMSTEDDEVDDNNTHNNEVDQETIFDKDDGVIFSDNIEDSGKEIGVIGHQLNQPSTPDNHHDQMKSKDYNSNPDDSDDCKAIQLLTSDCSTVKDIVPSGPLEKIFGQACNWHEVCYSCGELFGLLSSDCDMGFLEQSRLACNDSSSCETASRLILMPLRQRRTFYKRKVSPMCYQQPCIENFLLKSR